MISGGRRAVIAGIVLPASVLLTSAGRVAAQAPQFPDPPVFTRYTTPAECARAATWTEQAFWAHRRPDTVFLGRHGVPLQRTTVAVARDCVSRFQVATVPRRDLLGLGEAYLAAEQFELADSAFARLARSVAPMPVPQRGWMLYQIVTMYLRAAQPRTASAQRYVAQLDALGPPAATERMLAHLAMVRQAHAQDSVPLWDHEVTAALAAQHEIAGDLQRDYAMEAAGAYGELSALRARQGDPAAAQRAVDVGRSELVPLRPSVTRAFDGMQEWIAFQGKPAPPLRATRWFNVAFGDTIHPKHGRPALFIFAAHNCDWYCFLTKGYSVLRRTAKKYAGAVDIVIATRTRGFFQTQLTQPDSEMVLTGRYFVNDLHLPVGVAIWHTDLGRRNDGRVQVLSAPNERAYDNPAPEQLVTFVIDTAGIIRLAIGSAWQNEAILDDVLHEVLTGVSPTVTRTPDDSTTSTTEPLTLDLARRIAMVAHAVDSVLQARIKSSPGDADLISSQDAAQKLSRVLAIMPAFRSFMKSVKLTPGSYIQSYIRISNAWQLIRLEQSLKGQGVTLAELQERGVATHFSEGDVSFVEQHAKELERMQFPEPGLY